MPAPIVAAMGVVLFIGTFVLLVRCLSAGNPARAPLGRQLAVAAAAVGFGAVLYVLLEAVA